jgi:putative transposase
MREYWDRYIRNEQHLHTVIEYIHQNPLKARLCSRPEEWRWSSASHGSQFYGLMHDYDIPQ